MANVGSILLPCDQEFRALNQLCYALAVCDSHIKCHTLSVTTTLPSTYLSRLSPNNSSPSPSSSAPLSPSNSDSSSKGGRSRPGLDVTGSRLPRDLRDAGLAGLATEKGSDGSSYREDNTPRLTQDVVNLFSMLLLSLHFCLLRLYF